MGIANTTASAALIAAFTGSTAVEVTGRGTGIDDAMLAHKTAVVDAARSAAHRPDPADPLGALAAVGGLEHAGLVGFVLGAPRARVPVVLDGVIAGAAALVAAGARARRRRGADRRPPLGRAGRHAARCAPRSAAARRPRPPPGRGVRCAARFGLVQSAARILRDVATFDSAGVTEKE